jgi:hypothetical protein
MKLFGENVAIERILMPREFLTHEEEDRLQELIREWAMGHPQQDRVLFVSMGEALTPVQYFHKVREDKEFRLKLFTLLATLAHRANQEPEQLIRRAIQANKI